MKQKITIQRCSTTQTPVAKTQLKRPHKTHCLARLSTLLLALLLLIDINAKAQVRPDINSLTPAQHIELAGLIHNYLDAPGRPFVFKHDPTRPLHQVSPFLPWHRYYIGIIEDYLVSIGKGNYVPLPMWNPVNAMPLSFKTGANSVLTGNAPFTPFAAYTEPANQTIFSTDLLFNSTLCNATSRDNITNLINNPIHGAGHVRVGGAMATLPTAAGASIFYLWHGYIDDLWRQWECNCIATTPDKVTGVDLYMKDRNNDDVSNTTAAMITEDLDMGYQPFTTTQATWESEDIWVRNIDDGKFNEGVNFATTNPGMQTHQNPIFGQTNYIYVRVRNRSCTNSLGTEKITVNWAKQSTALGWPASWDGTGAAPSPCTAGLQMGDYVDNPTGGTLHNLPIIPKGGQAIIKIAWNTVPNPAAYTSCGIDSLNPFNICLLARIIATNDTMHIAEGADVNANVKNNNNIIMRNGTAVDCNSNDLDVEVGNPTDTAGYYSYHYDAPSYQYDNPITDYANVSVYLGPDIYTKWQQGGYQGYGVIPDTTAPYTVNITEPKATIGHLYFDAYEKYIVQTNVGYSAGYNDPAYNNFSYNIYQTNDYDSSYSGGVTYDICKPECPVPDAGYNTPLPCDGGAIYLNAYPIPGATYTWYNTSTGQIVGTGDSLYAYTSAPTTYKVEVTSPNGCKDYDYKKATMITNLEPYNYAQNTSRNKNLSWSPPEEYGGQYDVYLSAPQTGAPDPYFMHYTQPVATTYGTAIDPSVYGTLLPNTIYSWYVTPHGYLDTNCTAYQFATGTGVNCDPPLIYGVGRDTIIQYPSLPVYSQPTSYSPCGGTVITYTDSVVPLCGNSYAQTRRYKATNGQGLSSYDYQTITVEDTYAPVIAPLPAPSSIICHYAPQFTQAVATDASSALTLTYSDEEEHDFCGSHTAIRTWTAYDGCNTTYASEYIFIDHTAPPFITPAVNVTVSAGTNSVAQLNAWLNANGNSDLDGDCDEGDHYWINDYTGLTTVGNTSYATVTFSVKHPCSEYSSTTATFTIVNGTGTLSVTASSTPVTCNGGYDGTATIIASGGTPTYVYLWNTGATTQSISNLQSGIYSATVVDSNGDFATITVFVSQPQALSLTASASNVSCFGANDGAIYTTLTGATSAVEYQFITSDICGGCTAPKICVNGLCTTILTIPNLLNASPSAYTIVATDASGCSASTSVVVTQPTPLTLTINNIINVSCPGGNDGSFGFIAAGGAGSYTYNVQRISPVTCCQDPNCGINPDFSCVSCACQSSSAGPYTNLAARLYIVNVTDANNCSVSQSVTITEPIIIPPIITGPSTLCSMNAQVLTYSITALPAASSYQWSVPLGVNIVSGQGSTSITVTLSAASVNMGVKGNICVLALSPCGVSSPSCLAIDISGVAPVTPPSISGNGKACPGNVATYSISSVSRATSYQWTVPSGAIISSGQGSNIITVTYQSSFAGGVISVNACNACGCGPVRTKSISVNNPATPGTIVGQQSGVCGSIINYSVAASTAATSYIWTVSSGAMLLNGQGTNAITVSYNTTITSGIISVAVINGCGSSAVRTLSVSGTPAIPGNISGPLTVCTNSANNVYAVSTVIGTTIYEWTAPATATITTGQGSKIISLAYGSAPATGQVIKVKTTNACGSSSIRSLNNVVVTNCPRVEIFDDASFDLQVYPNPAHEALTVSFNADEQTHYVLQLLDITGRIVLTNNGKGSGNALNMILNVGAFAKGMYSLRVITDKGASQKNIVLQ